MANLGLGNALRKARIEKHYSQEYVAEMVNITATHIKHIEGGHRNPSLDVLFALAKVLDFSIDNYLITDSKLLYQEERAKLDLLLSKCNEKQLNVLISTAEALINNGIE